MKHLPGIPESKRNKDQFADHAVRMPFPGRKATKVGKCALACALVTLTILASFSSLLPGIVGTLYPGANTPFPNTPSHTNSTQDGPRTPLLPGTLQKGSRDVPFSSKITDSSIPPTLTRNSGNFLYHTSYGIYSFKMPHPYIFTLTSRSGFDLTRGSWFFVNSSLPRQLSPGNSTVIVSTDSQFDVSYSVLYDNLTVGTMELRADFSQNAMPKLTSSFSESPAWNLGSFNIFWSTVSIPDWFRPISGASDGPANPNSLGSNAGLRMINSSQVIPRLSSSAIEIGASKERTSWSDSLVIDWTDAHGGILQTGPTSVGEMYENGINVIFPRNIALIDPIQAGVSSSGQATAYSTQRKTFDYGGYSFVFYYDGSNIVYSTSLNGLTWTPGYTGSGPTKYGFDVYDRGSTVAMTWIDYNPLVSQDGVSTLRFLKGSIIGGSISWNPIVNVTSLPQHLAWPPSAAIGSDGVFWAGGVWPITGGTNCIVIYRSSDGTNFSLSTSYPTSNPASRLEALELIPLWKGEIMALSSHYNDTTIRWSLYLPVTPTYFGGGPAWLNTRSFNAYLPANTPKWSLISAIGTLDGFVHLITTPGATYWYYNDTSGSWSTPQQVDFAASDIYPSIATDSLGGLQAAWMSDTLRYFFKPKNHSSWLGGYGVFASGMTNATWFNAERAVSKQLIILWTVPSAAHSSTFNVMVGMIPLVSGIASSPPFQSWSKLGVTDTLASAEYVAPGNGLLALAYTDISASGRNRLDLSIRRVYLEPFTIMNGWPFNYETSPYSDLGIGWQLNIPWVGQQYLHYSDGQIFPIVWKNYTSSTTSSDIIKTWSFENHGSLDFAFLQINDTSTSTWITTVTYKLTTNDGTTYNFNNVGLITSMIDKTGQNQITFTQGNYSPSYNLHNTLTSITDTIGRIATLLYTPDQTGKLANITYAGQTVNYAYSGSNLVSVKDALQRTIGYSYSSQNNWLVAGVTYPTGGTSSYTYGSTSFGTDATNYYVTLQNIYAAGLVRSTSYSYQITDGTVTFTSVSQSDGTAIQGSTRYEFNAPANSMTVTTLDQNGIQMKKVRYWNDANGRVVQQDVYNGNSNMPSFYTQSAHDQWGNQISSRDALGHQSYASFANTDSQYRLQGTGNYSATTSGRLFYDDFNDATLDTSTWITGGSGVSRSTTTSSSLLSLQTASSSQGLAQSDWVMSAQTFGFPFYAEVQTSLGANPGRNSIESEFELSPETPGANGNPNQNPDSLRVVIADGPRYYVYKSVAGVVGTIYDSGLVQGDSTTIQWKIILTDSNTLTVYLNNGSGYSLILSTTTLGLSAGFASSNVYLAFYNVNTAAYTGSFDYVGLDGSNTITINGLQPGQKAELYDSNSVLQSSATDASGQTSVSLNGTNMTFPYGYLKIYEQDARTLQSISPTREIWGGTVYSYSPPFRSGGLYRTSTGYLSSTAVYFDDNLPGGAQLNYDGLDGWNLAGIPYAPVASGNLSHIGWPTAGEHEHYFWAGATVLPTPTASFHVQYVFIPSTSVPSEIMLRFHDNPLANPGFETGDFTSWTQNGMIIRGDYVHSGSYAAAPSYNPSTQTYSAFTLQQTFPSPIPGNKISTISFWYAAGDSNVDSAQVLYSDGTHSSTALGAGGCSTPPPWTLASLPIDSTKQVTGLKIVRSAASQICNIILDDFTVSGTAWEHRAYWGSNSINWGTDGTISRRNMGAIPSIRDSWAELIVKTDDVGTNLMGAIDGLGYTLYGGGVYWDFSAIGGPPTGTITVNGLLPGQRVELYDANWILKVSGTVPSGATSILLDVYDAGINTFPFSGYLKVYSAAGSLQYASPLNSDIWGGDVYTYSQPVFTNSFNFAAIGSSIHNALLGLGQYQNATSPLEIYSKYDSVADLLQQSQRYDSPNGLQWISTSSTFDAYGNPLSFTDGRGNTTYYTYDSQKYHSAYLTNETRRDGSTQIVTRYGYNFTTGNRLWTYDPRQYNTTYQYDVLGRLTRVNYPNNLGSISYNYVDSGNYVNTTSPNGFKTRQIYDLLGRETVVEKFLGGAPYSNQTSTYNWANLVSSTSDQLGHTTSYKYDYLGRLIQTTKPDGNVTQISYNDALLQVRTVDEYSKSRCSTFDQLGHLATVIEVANSTCTPALLAGYSYVSHYSYDWAGNLRTITNAALQITKYSYDNLNRLTSTTYPDGTTESYLYDSNSNLIKKTDRAGAKTLLSYDALNRAKTLTFCGNPTTSTEYTYDNNGNILTVQNENTTITYTYDARNRVLSERYQVNPSTRTITDLGCTGNGNSWPVSGGVFKDYTVTFAYNKDVLDSITYPTPSGTITNIAVGYSYDGAGRVRSLNQTGTSTVFATLSYFKTDQVQGIQYGNGLTGNYTYDSLLRPSSITLKNGVNSPILSLSYKYNNTGTVASIIGQVNGATVNEAYKYDSLGRLTNATVASQGATNAFWYQYDNLGNQISQKNNTILTTFSYNLLNNQLTGSSTQSSTTAYGYDGRGYLTTKALSLGTTPWSYNWNNAGQMVTVWLNGALQARYSYDGEGRQVESFEASTSSTTFYAYTGTETLYKHIYNAYSTDFLYAQGLRIASVDSSSGKKFDTILYFHTDALGSNRMITRQDKSVLFADGYSPYGKDNGTPTGSDAEKFTGKTVSPTTGLYYEYARWYDPAVGRFTSQDSFSGFLSDPQSLNTYAYTENNPTTYSDPTGHLLIEAGIGAFIGAGSFYIGCGIFTGGWFSSSCGEQAALGAGVGALAGATDGLSLLFGGGCEVEDCIPPPDPDPTTDPTTNPCLCPSGGDPGLGGSTDTTATSGQTSTVTSTETVSPTGTVASTGTTSIEIVDISRSGFEEAQSEGVFGNQPTPLAQGNYAHQLLGSGKAPTALSRGNFPDQFDTNGFTEIKPFHDGINPLEEYGPQLDRYTRAFQQVFDYAPSVRLILYRYI